MEGYDIARALAIFATETAGCEIVVGAGRVPGLDLADVGVRVGLHEATSVLEAQGTVFALTGATALF